MAADNGRVDRASTSGGRGPSVRRAIPKRWARRAPKVIAVVVASGIAALVIWNVVRLARGQMTVAQLTCIDPTDPCNVSTYRVRNDINQLVVLRECMHHCGRDDRRLDPITLPPGETTPDTVAAVTALVGSRAWWEVQSRSGHALGCLVLDGHPVKRNGFLVDVSDLERCTLPAPSTSAEAAS